MFFFLLVFVNLNAGAEEPVQEIFFRAGGGRACKYIITKDHSVYQLKELELRWRHVSEFLRGKTLELPSALKDDWDEWKPGSEVQLFSQDVISKKDRENILNPEELTEYPYVLFNFARGTYFFAKKRVIGDPLNEFPAFAFKLGYFSSFDGTSYEIPEIQNFFGDEWDPSEYPKNFKKLFFKTYMMGNEHGRQVLDQLLKVQQAQNLKKMADDVSRMRDAQSSQQSRALEDVLRNLQK